MPFPGLRSHGLSDAVFGTSLGIVIHVTDLSSEVAVLDDKLIHHVEFKTAETAVLDDASRSTTGAKHSEVAVLDDKAVNAGTLTTKASEVAVLDDRSPLTRLMPIAETAVLDDASRYDITFAVTSEAAVLDDAIGLSKSVSDKASETAVLDDSTAVHASTLASETAVLDDAARSNAAATLFSETAVLDDASRGGSRSARASEVAVLDDAAYSLNHAYDRAIETAVILDGIAEALAGNAWAAPTDLFNASRYTNFPFNSLAVVSGQLVGLTADGAYLISGATDAGEQINGAVVGDISDAMDGDKGPVSVPNVKRPAYLYLSYQTTGTVKFVLGETGDGVERRHEFELPARAALGMIGGRVQLNDGIESRFFRCGFETVAGAPFAINDARVMFRLLQRRA